MMKTFFILICVLSTTLAVTSDETIDEQLTEVLNKDHVKVSAVIELPDGKFLHDLDEEFTAEQFADIYGLDALNNSRRGITVRAAAIRTNRWTNNVFPYVLDRSYRRSKDRDLVLNGMKELEKGTCLKFVQRRRERNYVEFINGGGCYSMLGMIGGKQQLSLSTNGCRWRATVLHEILHALGIIHEQERPDRDNFVRIITRNMMRGMQSQFDKARERSTNYYGVPYDFSSVMHYGLKSFSSNGRRTIEPISEKNAEKFIGRQLHSGLSFGDYKLVNAMYNCAGSCSTECRSPGYLNKECKCVQPKDFYEENCRGNESTGWCYKYKVQMEETGTGSGGGTGTGTGGGTTGTGGGTTGTGGGTASCEDKRCNDCRMLKKQNKCSGL